MMRRERTKSKRSADKVTAFPGDRIRFETPCDRGIATVISIDKNASCWPIRIGNVEDLVRDGKRIKDPFAEGVIDLDEVKEIL